MNTGPTYVQTAVIVPGHGRFTVTVKALAMIAAFGGALHCYQGPGGCRDQGLYFSRTRPKKFLAGTLESAAAANRALTITISHELANRLNGAVLDFGNYNRMNRFVWTALPAGKRSPCLDDIGVGITDL